MTVQAINGASREDLLRLLTPLCGYGQNSAEIATQDAQLSG
jgi:hypothetical protein